MKRSEAEAKIHEYLVRNSIQEISPSQILGLVEKIGMMPPQVESNGVYFDETVPTLGELCYWELEQ